MRRCLVLAAFFLSASCQTIQDVITTTYDQSTLFDYTHPIIAFGSDDDAPSTNVNITVNDSTIHQTIIGFGGTLTDSAAQVLNDLKSNNESAYWTVLEDLFDSADDVARAGLTYLRVPLGATDFSSSVYSYDDTDEDVTLSDFSINAAPSYVYDVIADIQSISSILNIHLVPWSPPGWMKSGNSMKGGSLEDNNVDIYAMYLLKCLQAFDNKGITPYAISIQNEPENPDDTYPSTNMSVSKEAAVGNALRGLMDSNDFSDVKIIGYEHNWVDAAGYPVQLMDRAANAFAGVSFHCYAGSVDQQDSFHSAYPDKEIFETECTGTPGSDWWDDIQWYMDNLFIGALKHNAKSGAMWLLAADEGGKSPLQGSDSCPYGCRGIVTINDNGTYTKNQEFYALAQASRAIIPKDSDGPFGSRIAVTTTGNDSSALRVGAYQTNRTSSSDPKRYSLVVLNSDDSDGPSNVTATIGFRGKQAAFAFPVGLTTLWWFADPVGPHHSVCMDPRS